MEHKKIFLLLNQINFVRTPEKFFHSLKILTDFGKGSTDYDQNGLFGIQSIIFQTHLPVVKVVVFYSLNYSHLVKRIAHALMHRNNHTHNSS